MCGKGQDGGGEGGERIRTEGDIEGRRERERGREGRGSCTRLLHSDKNRVHHPRATSTSDVIPRLWHLTPSAPRHPSPTLTGPRAHPAHAAASSVISSRRFQLPPIFIDLYVHCAAHSQNGERRCRRKGNVSTNLFLASMTSLARFCTDPRHPFCSNCPQKPNDEFYQGFGH